MIALSAVPHAGPAAEVAAVVGTSVLSVLLAPAAVRVARGARPASPPMSVTRAAALGAGFAVLHALVTGVVVLVPITDATHLSLHALLLAGAIAFWWPVLGPPRLPPARRAAYLIAAVPALDLGALAVLLAGQETAGLASVVAMLPLAAAAVITAGGAVRADDRAAAPFPATAPDADGGVG